MTLRANPKIAEALALIGTPYDRRKTRPEGTYGPFGELPRYTPLAAALALGIDPQGVYRALRKQAKANPAQAPAAAQASDPE